ncbi:restriction endonuclease subunit S [Streptomyces arboris]
MLSIRRVFKVINGGTPTSDQTNWGGDILWATPVDFSLKFNPINQTRRTLTRTGASTGSAITPAGSLLLSTRAPIGYIAITTEAMAFNQGCRALAPQIPCDPRFFGYQLEAYAERLQAEGSGSTFTELSSDSLASFLVSVPPLEEQHRIADFLDVETNQIDRLTNLRRQQLHAIEERHEAEYLEVIQDLDADWVQLRRLGATAATGPFGTQFSADDYEVDGIPMINTAHIRDGKITPDPRHSVSEETANRLSRHQLKSGDIVIARKRHLGRAAAVKSSQAGWLCGTDSIALTVPRERAHPDFLEHLLRSRYVRSQLLKNSLAATIPNLNEGNLLELEVPHVTLGKQREFCTRLTRVDSILADTSTAMIRQLSLLAERRQALITAAVTGQFDVSTASGRGVTDGVSA